MNIEKIIPINKLNKKQLMQLVLDQCEEIKNIRILCDNFKQKESEKISQNKILIE